MANTIHENSFVEKGKWLFKMPNGIKRVFSISTTTKPLHNHILHE